MFSFYRRKNGWRRKRSVLVSKGKLIYFLATDRGYSKIFKVAADTCEIWEVCQEGAYGCNHTSDCAKLQRFHKVVRTRI